MWFGGDAVGSLKLDNPAEAAKIQFIRVHISFDTNLETNTNFFKKVPRGAWRIVKGVWRLFKNLADDEK